MRVDSSYDRPMTFMVQAINVMLTILCLTLSCPLVRTDVGPDYDVRSKVVRSPPRVSTHHRPVSSMRLFSEPRDPE